MTLARHDLEVMLFWIARMRELVGLVSDLLGQVQGYLEHLRHGGDPNEMRRNKWITRDLVKARYRGK